MVLIDALSTPECCQKDVPYPGGQHAAQRRTKGQPCSRRTLSKNLLRGMSDSEWSNC